MRGNVVKISSRQGGKITVTLPYNPIYIEKLKGIKGHRWHPQEIHLTVWLSHKKGIDRWKMINIVEV